MKKKIIISVFLSGCFLTIIAQEKIWALNDCLLYAVENSPKVKQKIYQTDNYNADHLAALGAFLPGIGGGSNLTYNFGRSITDDNTYKDASNMQNSYYLNASLPLFYGGQLINQWKQAQVNKKLGKSDEQYTKDQVAMSTLEAFMNVIYYQGMIQLAAEKLEESSKNYLQTKRMEELGLKSKADLTQIEAQMAGDDYLLTQQENLYNTSLLTLKELMNYPYDEPLVIDTLILKTAYLPEVESVENIYEYAQLNNPQALAMEYQLQSYQYQHRIVKGKLYPTISFSTGASTYYYRELSGGEKATSFHDQFNNKMGEYVTFSVSVPIFQGFSRLTHVRKARNNVRIAAEQQTETLRQIQNAIEQNVLDRNGYAKEIIQMEKQVDANNMAYRLTARKYEEGLMSSLDLQTSSYNLLQSRSNLLQRKLMYIIKDKIVNYYKGISLLEE